jgi:Rps23 Pro-64 3,4-dihydroxylase Tpa1-like proline 4-hydroxylase
MSAYVDQDQPVKFYYGNAIKDLKDFLPPDEAPTQTYVAASNVMQSLDDSLSSLESLMSELKGAQRELSFLVHDLNRMIKKHR